jgi:hypothetical protein
MPTSVLKTRTRQNNNVKGRTTINSITEKYDSIKDVANYQQQQKKN